MYKRLLSLDKKPKRSFFLWGMRQVGKSTLLKGCYGNATFIDLLKSDEFARYARLPSLLREEIQRQGVNSPIVIDEIQKIPALLDEVHWLIENLGATFILCGSSARKLKRVHANMLGGRALRYELFGLIRRELGAEFNLEKVLNRGYLPTHYLAEDAEIKRLMLSYTGDYLREEITAEALVRNLVVFSDFLEKAALSDTEIVSYSTFARDVGVSSNTIKDYYSILVDTLLGSFLHAYTKNPKRRTVASPKFYFNDVGIVNHLAKRGYMLTGSPLYGKAFENWVYHELRACNQYCDRLEDIYYWRLTTGVEVDFIVGHDLKLACEAKATTCVTSDDLRGLRELAKEHPTIGQRIVVSLESKSRRTDDGIDILTPDDFVEHIWTHGFTPPR